MIKKGRVNKREKQETIDKKKNKNERIDNKKERVGKKEKIRNIC